MATRVVYNGVVLHNVLTRQWDERVIYDPSNTDIVRHEYTLSFEGLLFFGVDPQQAVQHPVWTGIAAPGQVPGQRPVIVSTNYSAIRSYLLQARKALQVYTGDLEEAGALLFACDPADAVGSQYKDVDNGPKPLSLNLLQIIGQRIARVQFTIQCSRVDCLISENRPTVPVVLSHRWGVEETVDANAQVTRLISGKVHLSSPVFFGKATDPRPWTIPALEPGFRRESMRFSASADGLTCDYQIMDRQVYTAAPWPCTSVRLEHTEQIVDKLNMSSIVSVHLEAPPNADRALVLLRLLQLLDARVGYIATMADPERHHATGQMLLRELSITEHFGEVFTMDGHMRIDHALRTGIAMVFTDHVFAMKENLALGDVPRQPYPYKPNISPGIPYNGVQTLSAEPRPAVFVALACYFQRPCDDNHRMYPNVYAPPDLPPPDNRPPTPPIYESPGYQTTLPSTSYYDPSAAQRIYTHVALTTRYEMNAHVVQLPIAPLYAGQSVEQTCVVLPLGLPTARRIIEFDVETSGKWPEAPVPIASYADGSLRAVLQEATVEPQPPAVAADQITPIYRLSGRYVYALNRPPRGDEKIDVGLLPYTNFPDRDIAKFDPTQAFSGRMLPGDGGTTG